MASLAIVGAIALAFSPVEAESLKRDDRNVQIQRSFHTDTLFPSDIFLPGTPLTRAFPTDVFSPQQIPALNAQGIMTVEQFLQADVGEIEKTYRSREA
ncbi:hypothetical protein JAO82_11305 [Pontibaca sp. S1109L]|uniref:Uncharacterized protein n=1 Tax=Pontibaca salina TaxID=2795731 RepID=A0A934LZ32_9RHOB|nr:hypothetical protein [Pontibaca salina]